MGTIQSVRYIFLVYLPSVIDRVLERVKESILKELRSRQNVLMGQKDIENKGSVSFFLKKIDENKKNGQKGEINETL